MPVSLPWLFYYLVLSLTRLELQLFVGFVPIPAEVAPVYFFLPSQKAKKYL